MQSVAPISGFPELLPQEQLIFNRIIRCIQDSFESYGFTPLETVAVERATTLLSKGNDHEIYGLHRLLHPEEKKDSLDQSLALRFDLTIPLARYVSQHHGKLVFPYRRYHIAPVWRGERAQSGRYRQFYQCDIDVVGNGCLSLSYDGEILVVMHNTLQSIGITTGRIEINHRLILVGLLLSMGVTMDNLHTVLRLLDKYEKLAPQEWLQTLQDYVSLKDSQVLQSLQYEKSYEEWMDYLPQHCTHELFLQGLKEIQQCYALALQFGVPKTSLYFTPCLARGLSYYTGMVVEVKLPEHPELGSICGGGRYEELASHFTPHNFPGVGISIGISRLLPYFLKKDRQSPVQTPAKVLVTVQNPDYLPQYISWSQALRQNNIKTEIYLMENALGTQMKYANKKGFQFAIIGNKEEIQNGKLVLRTLKDATQQTLSLQQAIEYLKIHFS